MQRVKSWEWNVYLVILSLQVNNMMEILKQTKNAESESLNLMQVKQFFRIVIAFLE